MRYLSPENPNTIEELSSQCWAAVEAAKEQQAIYNQFANPVRMNGGSWRAVATNNALSALYG